MWSSSYLDQVLRQLKLFHNSTTSENMYISPFYPTQLPGLSSVCGQLYSTYCLRLTNHVVLNVPLSLVSSIYHNKITLLHINYLYIIIQVYLVIYLFKFTSRIQNEIYSRHLNEMVDACFASTLHAITMFIFLLLVLAFILVRQLDMSTILCKFSDSITQRWSKTSKNYF